MSDPFSAIAGLGERLNRLSRRMTPGALGGRTDLASPKVAVAGMVPPVLPPIGASGGNLTLTDYITVVVMPEDGVNLITGGYNEFDIQFTEVVASSGDALSWPGVGFDDHTVFVHEQGLYMFSGGFYAKGTNGATGPVQARITDQGGNPALGLAIGGSYFGGSDTYVGTSWGLFELFDYSEMRLRVEHDVRTPSVPGPSVGDELTDAGNARSWYTYLTIAKVVPAVTGGGGGGLPFCWAALDSVPAGGVLSDVPDSTWTPIAIDSGDSEQVGSNFSLDDLTGEVTVLADVAVEVAVYSTFVANATNERGLRVQVNGSGWPLRAIEKFRSNLGSGNEVRLDAFGAGRLFAGDVVTVEMWQNSGGGLGIVAGMLTLTVLD